MKDNESLMDVEGMLTTLYSNIVMLLLARCFGKRTIFTSPTTTTTLYRWRGYVYFWKREIVGYPIQTWASIRKTVRRCDVEEWQFVYFVALLKALNDAREGKTTEYKFLEM